jgi:hypothetical protein
MWHKYIMWKICDFSPQILTRNKFHFSPPVAHLWQLLLQKGGHFGLSNLRRETQFQAHDVTRVDVTERSHCSVNQLTLAVSGLKSEVWFSSGKIRVLLDSKMHQWDEKRETSLRDPLWATCEDGREPDWFQPTVAERFWYTVVPL